MCFTADNNDLFGPDSDTKTNLYQHLKRKWFEMWSKSEAECLCQMLSQSTELSWVLSLLVGVRSRAAVAHKKQLRPAYNISFANVVCCSVDSQAVNAVQ